MIPTSPAPTTAEQSAHSTPHFPHFRPTRGLIALCGVLIVVSVWSVGLLMTRPVVAVAPPGCYVEGSR